jgi:hypothetical protein
MKESAVQDKKIFELTEVYDERNGIDRISSDGGKSPQVIVIDGRGYERVKPEGQNIHDLTEIVEDRSPNFQINDLVMKRTEEIIERIARDMIPEIAERVIREEIEKLKQPNRESITNQD